jgi:hypothetical protein
MNEKEHCSGATLFLWMPVFSSSAVRTRISCSRLCNFGNACDTRLLVQMLNLEQSYILYLKFEKQSKTAQLVPWESSSSITYGLYVDESEAGTASHI